MSLIPQEIVAAAKQRMMKLDEIERAYDEVLQKPQNQKAALLMHQLFRLAYLTERGDAGLHVQITHNGVCELPIPLSEVATITGEPTKAQIVNLARILKARIAKHYITYFVDRSKIFTIGPGEHITAAHLLALLERAMNNIDADYFPANGIKIIKEAHVTLIANGAYNAQDVDMINKRIAAKLEAQMRSVDKMHKDTKTNLQSLQDKCNELNAKIEKIEKVKTVFESSLSSTANKRDEIKKTAT